MNNDRLPTPGRLRELLDYDPETGVLTRRPRTGWNAGGFNAQFAGKPAGTLRSDGYIAVRLDNVIYAAHRLVWALAFDCWPECVRHLNGNNADNRLANLYATTRSGIMAELWAEHRPAIQDRPS